MVADLALRSDVTDYIRFRGVCKPWRSAAIADPKLMGMNPRFFPRNWQMVRGRKARREETTRFYNGVTGASIHLKIPLEYGDVIASADGCLLLALRRTGKHEMRLFNPVTRAVADLPGVFNIDVFAQLDHAAGVVYDGEADADLTVVLSMRPAAGGTVVVNAKPGDAMWGPILLPQEGSMCEVGALSVRGRFYYPSCTGNVLRLDLQPRPSLRCVACQDARNICDPLGVTSYLLLPSYDDADDGMLLVRRYKDLAGQCDVFRVNLAGDGVGSLTMMKQEDIVNRNISFSRGSPSAVSS
jgi:hypothetical protein